MYIKINENEKLIYYYSLYIFLIIYYIFIIYWQVTAGEIFFIFEKKYMLTFI